MAARSAIHPTRHQDAQVFQGRRISGLHPRYTSRTDRGNEGLFDESVGIVVLLILIEKDEVVTICDHLKKLKFSPNLPYAFTEHGAIMLATILNSPVAVQASIQIVRAFIRLRQRHCL